MLGECVGDEMGESVVDGASLAEGGLVSSKSVSLRLLRFMARMPDGEIARCVGVREVTRRREKKKRVGECAVTL